MKKFFQNMLCAFLNHKWTKADDIVYPHAKEFHFNRCERCGHVDCGILTLIEYRMAKAEEHMYLELAKEFLKS